MPASESIRKSALDLLLDLIKIPSTRGMEGAAIGYLHEALSPHFDECTLVPVDDSIMDDPDYAFPLPGLSYAGRPNLECLLRGQDSSRAIVLNTHVDVVPPSEEQEQAFSPRVEDGKVSGRGACDAKGQVATLFALALLLAQKEGPLPADLIFHFVIEEENGGNGTLAMIRRGVKADAAVVLEPSELAVVPAVRGAVWFQLKTFGQAGHSGSRQTTVSALKAAVQAMSILEEYHDDLLRRSRGHPLFDQHADPMPITFGQCDAGRWPASVPSEATLKGVLGFLPNLDRHTAQREMRQALLEKGDEWLRGHFELSFPMLNSDGYALDEGHPLVTALAEVSRRNGARGEVRAMAAACDAWFYNNQLGIPTVVFGPGSLRHAHSRDEHIQIDDILTAASILADFVQSFTGLEQSHE